MGQIADHHRGDQYAEGGQQANRPAVAAQIGEVDMQRTGEQQERQHPVHQQVVEVDLVHQPLDACFQAGEADQAQALEDQGEQQCGDHHANGRWQAYEAIVDVGEEGGQADKSGNKFKHPKSCNSGFQVVTRSARAVL